jgi:hypothetical protein
MFCAKSVWYIFDMLRIKLYCELRKTQNIIYNNFTILSDFSKKSATLDLKRISIINFYERL